MALRQKKEISLGGTEFEINHLGATSGKLIYQLFMRAYLPAVDAVRRSGVAGGEGEAVLGAIMQALFAAMSADELEQICSAFSGQTRVKQGPVWAPMSEALFDEVFAANYSTMQSWLVAHVLHNGFLSFLADSRPTTPAQGDAR